MNTSKVNAQAKDQDERNKLVKNMATFTIKSGNFPTLGKHSDF